MKFINVFEIQEELKYCKDISRVDFFNSCINKDEECHRKKDYLLTYINHLDFFFKYGKYDILLLRIF